MEENPYDVLGLPFEGEEIPVATIRKVGQNYVNGCGALDGFEC